jgi:hypothetical protein
MQTTHRTLVALLSLVALSAGAACGAAPVAFLSNMKGDVAVDGNIRPTLLVELETGQKIVVGKDAQAAVMYIASGKEFVLKGPGEYVVKDADVAATSGVPPAARATEWRASTKVLEQVAKTASASVRMRSIAQPKADVGSKLLSPTQGTVTTLTPTFRWRADDPPKAQAEFVLRAAGQDKPVQQVKTAGGVYKAAKLKPGTEYTWTVVVNGDEVGTAAFRTLSTDEIRQVEQRRPSDKADFSERLYFTLMLQELGAAQEAQESWAKLSQERTDLPELAAFGK